MKNNIVLEPKPNRKQWKKSSRWRAAIKRAKGHNYTRLWRMSNGGSPFTRIAWEDVILIFQRESERLWTEEAHRLEKILSDSSPYLDAFPGGMGNVINSFGIIERRPSLWRRIKENFREWVASTDYWPRREGLTKKQLMKYHKRLKAAGVF